MAIALKKDNASERNLYAFITSPQGQAIIAFQRFKDASADALFGFC
jgi:hypothetical protein